MLELWKTSIDVLHNKCVCGFKCNLFFYIVLGGISEAIPLNKLFNIVALLLA